MKTIILYQLLLCLLLSTFGLGLTNIRRKSLATSSKSSSKSSSASITALSLSTSSLSLIPIIKFTGVTLFTSLQVSQVQTAIKILKERTTSAFPMTPHVALFTNCFVWFLYGLMKSDNILIYPNLLGIIAGLFSTISYQYVASKYDKKPMNKIIILLSTIIVLVTSLLFQSSQADSIGLLGCFMSISLSGSPLSVMKQVIKEKSSQSIVFSSSLIMFVNSLSWGLYGALSANDPMIYIPNFVGFLLGMIQMLLFVIYPAQSKTPSK